MKTVHKPKGICFFDLDGTLLDNGRNEIPESSYRALDELRGNDYLIVLSTGRDMDTHYSACYRDMVKPDAIIHHNGTKITIGEELIFEHFMEKELLNSIYRFCKEKDLCIGTSIGAEDFFLHPEVKYAAEKSYKKVVKRNFVPFEELFERKLPVSALSFAGNLSEGKPILESEFPEIELFAFNGGKGADVVERGFSKAEGCRKICSYYGVEKEETYAFGDSLNDIPMLKVCGTGIAMGNADEEAKLASDFITEDIRNDGIYNACKHFGLI